MKHGDEPSARVFRIHIDCARSESPKSDLRRSEPGPSLNGESARLQQLAEHLGEQVRLAKWLRGYYYGMTGDTFSLTREQKQEYDRDKCFHVRSDSNPDRACAMRRAT